jgi:hypothetical protein
VRILIIDDDESSVSALMDELNHRDHETSYRSFITNAADLNPLLDNLRPDLLVLDLKDKATASSSPNETHAGSSIFEAIWTNRFFPVLIYSAYPDLLVTPPNPFIGRIKKGSGSEIEAHNWIGSKEPIIKSLHCIDDEIAKSKHEALRLITEYLGEGYPDPGVVSYLIKRRIAAFMDMGSEGQTIPACSRYIYPPICEYPRLGDILRKNNNGEYRVILTPSCDMGDSGQSPKVTHALTSGCKNIDSGILERCQLGKKQDKIEGALSQGYFKEFVPIPALPSNFPNLLIDLKNLELISFEEIGLDDSRTYKRIASIDSPYREQISWAFIQTMGRPGVPAVDFTKWALEILNSTGNKNDRS